MPAPSSVDFRPSLRRRLIDARTDWLQGPQGAAAQQALAAHLGPLLEQLEPECLGVYWAMRGEFDVIEACRHDAGGTARALALPYVRREPPEMHFRRWDGLAPPLRDEAHIPASDGAQVVPDVLLVPCVGYTAEGFRLGYGGGYFDRWVAAHPHVTTIGIAWSGALLAPDEFAPQAHDQALTLVLTERGIA